MKKETILAALSAFVSQRSGIDYRNYSERSSFMSDYRPILRRGKQAREMIRQVAWRDSITAQNLIDASNRAFSGRLQFVERGDKVGVEYITGQYFPTEYRAAACAVLAQVLWSYWGENAGTDKNAASYIRKRACAELGRSIAREWFD